MAILLIAIVLALILASVIAAVILSRDEVQNHPNLRWELTKYSLPDEDEDHRIVIRDDDLAAAAEEFDFSVRGTREELDNADW